MNREKIDKLLEPRYEVIADYPDMNGWEVGEILDRDWGWNGDDEGGFKNRISQYPHLFRKLEWWERRRGIEMPKYAKVTVDFMAHYGAIIDSVHKVIEYGTGNLSEIVYLILDNKKKTFPIEYIIPITEKEYKLYINQKQNT